MLGEHVFWSYIHPAVSRLELVSINTLFTRTEWSVYCHMYTTL